MFPKKNSKLPGSLPCDNGPAAGPPSHPQPARFGRRSLSRAAPLARNGGLVVPMGGGPRLRHGPKTPSLRQGPKRILGKNHEPAMKWRRIDRKRAQRAGPASLPESTGARLVPPPSTRLRSSGGLRGCVSCASRQASQPVPVDSSAPDRGHQVILGQPVSWSASEQTHQLAWRKLTLWGCAAPGPNGSGAR